MPNRSPNPDPTSEKFFQEWELYQTVIEHDYMYHRPIASALREAIRNQAKDGMRILDLGCGDGHIVRQALSPLGKFSYTGVDQSRQALDIARDRLKELGWEQHLVQANLAEWLREAEATFDLIVTGFSLHHFYGDTLRTILTNMRRLLAAGGTLIIYDILARPEEDGDAFNQRLLSYADAEWIRMTPEQLKAVRNHVEPNDYPLDFAAWEKLVESTGLTTPKLRYYSPNELYGLMVSRIAKNVKG